MEIRNDILTLVMKLLNDDYETCGIAIDMQDLDYNSYLYFDDITHGERNSCSHLSYSSYIWHTHPRGSTPQNRKSISKFYPSPEDLVKICHNEKVMISLIFCTAGIWELCYFGRDFLPVDYESTLKIYNDKLYYKTIDGRIVNYDEYQKSEIHIDDYINSVSKYLSRDWENGEYKIKFTSWWDIEKQEPYILNFI